MEANNVKDMCEALKRLLNLAYEVQDLNSEDGPKTSVPSQFIIDVAKSALAAPPRNCDVGTAEEQAKRFILFCRRNSFRSVCNDGCKFANVNRRLGWQKIGQARCFPFWAQMPYEEGGAK